MIINIFFQILNFIVLIVLFYYFIQQIINPSIMQMIESYNSFVNKIKDDRKQLIINCKNVSEKIENQEEFFKAMQVKFLLWQEKCRDKKFLQIKDKEQVVANIHNRFLTRSQVVMKELAIKEQLPYILDRTTEKLQQKYHIVDSQKTYINELIHVMKEQI